MDVQKEKNSFSILLKSPITLKKAIQKLDVFASTYQKTGNMESLDLGEDDHQEIEKNRLTLFGKQVFKASFPPKGKVKNESKHKKIQKELVQALDVVKCYYRILEKFQNGTKEEKKLAAFAVDVISRCNAIIQKEEKIVESWRSRFISFLGQRKTYPLDQELKDSSIILPPFPSIEKIYPENTIRDHESSLFYLGKDFSLSFLYDHEKDLSLVSKKIPSQIIDAFKMKIITLLKKQTLFQFTEEEIRNMSKQFPIEVTQSNRKKEQYHLKQNVQLFPGEWIEVKGSFVVNLQEPNRSYPISESFYIWTKAEQTGFPRAKQYLWALDPHLLPDHPLRPTAVPRFYSFLQKKNGVAHSILPKGKWNKKAKEIIFLKEEIIQKEIAFFLNQHKLLTEAILWSNGIKTFHEKEWHVVDKFYQILEKRKDAFSFLCQVQEWIMESYVCFPYQKLHKEWLESDYSLLTEGQTDEKAVIASKILKEERDFASLLLEKEKKKIEDPEKQTIISFLQILGETIGTGTHPIIMQEMSEKIGFLPPLLPDFSKKLLTSALKQGEMFIQEMEMDLQEDEEENKAFIKKRMEEEWQRDLAIFSSPTFRTIKEHNRVITSELERYYRARFLRTL